MAYNTNETIKRYWQQFFREQLADIAPDERRSIEQEFEKRFEQLLDSSSAPSNEAQDGFIELIGFGPEGVRPFGEVPFPRLRADFDEAVIHSQLHAAAELYFCYQHEKMKVFEAVDVLRRLFALGRLKIQRGPGARGLYILEKWKPLRYSKRDRMIAYRRAFNYGTAPSPAGAIVNKNFHFQLIGFMSALAQYFRDLTVGDVIRGAPTLDQRPYGNIATVQRIGTDLRYALDRSSYGNILALTQEVGHYLSTILNLFDTPDLKRSFDANTKWDVLETVSNRYLGGAAELSQRAKMADAGRRVLQWVADNDFKTTADPAVFQVEAGPIGAQAEAWVAAYRMTPEGHRFPGVTQNLMWAVGLPDRHARRAVAYG